MTREMQIKTTINQYLTPIRQAKLENTEPDENVRYRDLVRV